MAIAHQRYVTEAEYLALEERSDRKHEYYNGRVYAMAGGSPEHAMIAGNAYYALRNLTSDSGCLPYGSDLRVKVEATGLETYPDVTVVCGDMRRSDTRPQACMNPAVVVEVLSGSTKAYDRGAKWHHYQTIESLTDYLLVAQDRPYVEHFTRKAGDVWEYRRVDQLDGAVDLGALDVALTMAELYNGVAFPEGNVLHDAPDGQEPA